MFGHNKCIEFQIKLQEKTKKHESDKQYFVEAIREIDHRLKNVYSKIKDKSYNVLHGQESNFAKNLKYFSQDIHKIRRELRFHTKNELLEKYLSETDKLLIDLAAMLDNESKRFEKMQVSREEYSQEIYTLSKDIDGMLKWIEKNVNEIGVFLDIK